MGRRRIIESGAAYYHVVSRVVDRRRVFDDGEKARFQEIMRAAEAGMEVEILTYTIMDDHFHVLLHVPQRHVILDRILQTVRL